jgi:hypothetical protein
MGMLDWLFKRTSEEAPSTGLSLPARNTKPVWRPAGLSPDQLDAFLRAYEPRALPPELSGGPPRKDVWGENALKEAAFHHALLEGNASPCLVTTVTPGGPGICIYRDGAGRPRSFPVEVPAQVRSFPLLLNAIELDGKQGVYEWLLWFPPAVALPPVVSAGRAGQLIDEGSPVHLVDVRRGALIQRTPIPGSIEHPVDSWESEDEKRGLVARLARFSGFEMVLLIDEEPARNRARVPPVEELRGRLESSSHRAALVSSLDEGYPAYVHGLAPQLPCFCQTCVRHEEERHFASMQRSRGGAGLEDYFVPRPLPGPEEMARRVQAMPAGQLPPELRRLPPDAVSRAVVVHKEHKQDNEGIDYSATYAWMDPSGQLRWRTAHHGWEGFFGASSFIAHLREGDVLHVIRDAGSESLHEQELLTQMGKTPFRGKW